MPNFIVMNMDNLGYGDLGCYGSNAHRTPHIDRLASQGMRLTSFYSTSGVCTPSRASLLTGCYPRRINMHVSGKGCCVLFPADSKGLNPAEKTVAAILREKGYATACIGKWHLGDQAPFLPTNHGFEYFFGCPYSDDMTPDNSHPDWPPLPLMRNDSVVEAPADRDTLTKRYTEESIGFIRANRNRSFFLYLAHAMPGSTNRPFSSRSFQGHSANGSYGDAVEELDWSAGQILATVKELGLDEKTLILFTSDNGAVGWNLPQGSNAPLKGWGYDTSEGSQRVLCLVRWLGTVPAGSIRDDVTTMMDILPTLASLAEVRPPEDRIIDGHDIRTILSGNPDARSPYDENGFFYYFREQLQAVRSGPWKLYLPLSAKLRNLSGSLKDAVRTNAELYDVRNDISETKEVSSEHPDVVQKLMQLAEAARVDLGDMDKEGANQRQAGWVEHPRPQWRRSSANSRDSHTPMKGVEH
jgi:arylsulfatase A-like enzyme